MPQPRPRSGLVEGAEGELLVEEQPSIAQSGKGFQPQPTLYALNNRRPSEDFTSSAPQAAGLGRGQGF